MKRVLLVLAAAALLPAGVSPSPAAPPSRQADVFNGIAARVPEGYSWYVICKSVTGAIPDLTLQALRVEGPGGVVDSTVAAIDNLRDTYVSVRGGEAGETVVVQEAAGPALQLAEFGRDSSPGETVYFAYASWGGVITCSMTVNNARMPELSFDTARATYALASDFDGGLGLAAPGLGVAAGAAETRTSDGLFVALFQPGAGEARIVDPTGAERAGSVVTERNDGTWRFEIDAAANTTQGVALWTLDFPDWVPVSG